MSLVSIEQNDIDISKLFQYRKELILKTPDGDEVTIYQRIVGDEHNNQGRVYGLRESAKLRENLRNTRWEDRKAYIPATYKFKKEELIDYIINMMVGEFTLKALNSTQIPIPKKPDGEATVEDQEKYQKKVDAYPEELNLAVTEKVTKEIEKQRKQLNSLNRDKLIMVYENALTNEYAQQVYSDSYYEYVTYYGTFINNEYTKHITKTFDDFLNLPTVLKKELIRNYRELELSTTDLKK